MAKYVLIIILKIIQIIMCLSLLMTMLIVAFSNDGDAFGDGLLSNILIVNIFLAPTYSIILSVIDILRERMK